VCTVRDDSQTSLRVSYALCTVNMCTILVVWLYNWAQSHRIGQYQRLSACFELLFTAIQSQSQSYITTDSQSVCKSWCRAQSGAFDQRYFSFFLFFFFFENFCLVIWGRPL
jgi:hypothetical protein